MAFRRANEGLLMSDMGTPSGPKLVRKHTLARSVSQQPRYWGKKVWILVTLTVAALLITIILVAVVVSRKNRYPAYTALNYTLVDSYFGNNFFSKFDYFTGNDPTSGFVHYVSSTQASRLNLTYASENSAILRVDTSVTSSSVPNASNGRSSVRISSKIQYGPNSLFVFDVLHAPLGCGTWPALWLTDVTHWPINGEIDIMEAVNVAGDTDNQITLHTAPGCAMDVKRKESGKPLQSSCVNSTNFNAGCSVGAISTSGATFGRSWNKHGGGYLALELRSAGIRVWQWARGDQPSNVKSDNPDPSQWQEATADFPGTKCDIGSHFRNQSIMINIALCGDWAGQPSIFNQTCPGLGLCADFVANNATAFTDAFWEFEAFKIYSAS